MKASGKSQEKAKTSMLAVISAGAGILGLIVWRCCEAGNNINPLGFLVPLFLALILGVIAIIWIILARGKLKISGVGFALVGIASCVVFISTPISIINSYANYLKSLTYRGKITASYINTSPPIGHVDPNYILNQLKSRDPIYRPGEYPPLSFNPHKGTIEWVQFDWDSEHEIRRVKIFWCEDLRAECHVPKSWSVLYKDTSNNWKKVNAKTTYTTVVDEFNIVDFAAVKTDAIKIEIELQDEYSAGLHRVIIE
jgi:hypothetical protein